MKPLITCLFGLVCACASHATSAPPQPTSCKDGDIHGTYLQHYEKVGGNCSAPADRLVDADSPGTCTVTRKLLSQNNCRIDITEKCDDGSSAVGFLVITAAGGATLSGKVTVTVEGSCSGTFDVSYARQ